MANHPMCSTIFSGNKDIIRITPKLDNLYRIYHSNASVVLGTQCKTIGTKNKKPEEDVLCVR